MGVGTHLLLDLYGVSVANLTDRDLLTQTLLSAAHAACMTPLAEPFLHTFPGGGLTGFLPLAESHLAFHTYPEHGYIAIDCFTCGDPDGTTRAQDVFCQALHPSASHARVISRGEKIAQRREEIEP
jgi:S-adenosylmethionine decarboxylase